MFGIFRAKKFDKIKKSKYNNYRKWRNHKRGLPKLIYKNTSNSAKFTDVFFYWLNLFANNYN